MKVTLKRIWHDPVWSKVIASVILAVVVTVGGIMVKNKWGWWNPRPAEMLTEAPTQQNTIKGDSNIANKPVLDRWSKFAGNLCDLPTLGEKKFLDEMQFFSQVELPRYLKETVAYRLAFAINLLETNRRSQALEILHDLAASPKSCQQSVAAKIVAPPSPGRRIITSVPPVENEQIAAQLVDVDVGERTLTLHLILRNNGMGMRWLVFARPGWVSGKSYSWDWNHGFGNISLPYLVDDDGAVLTSTTGWTGPRIGRPQFFADALEFGHPRLGGDGAPMTLAGSELKPGESIPMSATFPMISPGSTGFKLFNPPSAFERVALKPGIFEK